ncbi:methylmalonyl-CoA epimerase [Bordetella petrii]|nr:methylmalonyl-CoA epimerase [Bordetella petrii]
MKIKGLGHVAVVVRDVDASRHFWQDCLGLRFDCAEEFPASMARLSIYRAGNDAVELISGTAPESRYSRMIEEGRGGLNHICLLVEDIEAALAELKEKNVPLLDAEPRKGHGGSLIAFIDPAATDNCLVELAQMPGGTAA